MSTLPVASRIEILDLRHFSARQLRPLLEQEALVWRDRLRWDYASSTELLLQYLESRILQGFVALDRGRVCGYVFCVYEGQKAVIGDAFALGLTARGHAPTARILLVHMLEMLRHSPAVDRIEAQLLLFDSGEFADILIAPNLTIHPRLFLECQLRRPVLRQTSSPPALPPHLLLTPWTPPDYQAAGELIYSCYTDHADAHINDQYRSLHGCLRFLHNIVRFPGCGVFQPALSWLLRLRDGGTPIGLILTSRIGHGVAHITQLCIAGEHRGQGLGAVLLGHCLENLERARYEAVSLTVTEQNRDAVRLYEQFRFTPRHRFDAIVLETNGV